MRQDNIFKVGSVVSSENLIGYRDEYKRFCRDILGNRVNLSLVGLPRMGKTSLIKKLHDEAKKITRSSSKFSSICRHWFPPKSFRSIHC